MKTKFTNEEYQRELEKNKSEAKKVLKDPEKLDKTLAEAERKLKTMPGIGGALSNIPVMIQLLRSYARNEYDKAPMGTLIAILGVVLYWINPFDLISDFIPIIGMLDDAGVAMLVMPMAKSDLEDYKIWRAVNGK